MTWELVGGSKKKELVRTYTFMHDTQAQLIPIMNLLATIWISIMPEIKLFFENTISSCRGGNFWLNLNPPNSKLII